MSRCIGYGDLEDRCERQASGPGGIWCARCQRSRCRAIGRVFERIGALFAAELARMVAP